MATHFKSECKHGVLVSQCRCPSKDKSVRIVPCPKSCQVTVTPEPYEEPDWEDIVRTIAEGRFLAAAHIYKPRLQPNVAAECESNCPTCIAVEAVMIATPGPPPILPTCGGCG